jgi:CRP-like cAMP-binding protein
MQKQLHALLEAALPGCRDAGVVDSLARCFAPRGVRKGEVVLRQGDHSTQVFLVEAGSLRLYFVRPDGREFNKNFHAEGAILLPLTPAMWHEPSLFGIAAMEPTQLWCADAVAMRRALESAGLWHTVQRKALAQLVTHKLQREHDLLALTGSERYADFCRRHPTLSARVPLGHLASYLGVTDVSLSRIRRAAREGKPPG